MDLVKGIPVYSLGIGGKFMTRLTAAYGEVLAIAKDQGQPSEVKVSLTYPDGRYVLRWVHPDLVVDQET